MIRKGAVAIRPSGSAIELKQRFGAHMSVAGGLENAFAAGADVGCECLQVFVKNQRQWSAPALKDDQVAAYREAAERTGLSPVVAHASYLINLASPDEANRSRGIAAVVDELKRCERLGIDGLVLHPGAHMGEGVDAGIGRIADGLNQAHRKTPGFTTRVLLETTAGQGSSIGHELGHLSRIIDGVDAPRRIGVCIDTCHVFAAGYDISDEKAYASFMDELTSLALLELVGCLHVNDSKGVCGSRLDRHDHIGKGRIGKNGFAPIIRDPRLAHVPRILETPKGKDGRGADFDRLNLKRLRALLE
ncbi:MAG: deoxyribonuclease IV [Phycisphaerales bacterium]|nr:deoxyribonuclease IV [Phycisphaerales bacterium]